MTTFKLGGRQAPRLATPTPKPLLRLKLPPRPSTKGRSHTGVQLPPTEALRDDALHGTRSSKLVDRANSLWGTKEKALTTEVSISEHTTRGRQALERVCSERGLMWGIICSSLNSGKAGAISSIRVSVLVGTRYECEADDIHGYPQTVDEALLKLAATIEQT